VVVYQPPGHLTFQLGLSWCLVAVRRGKRCRVFHFEHVGFAYRIWWDPFFSYPVGSGYQIVAIPLFSLCYWRHCFSAPRLVTSPDHLPAASGPTSSSPRSAELGRAVMASILMLLHDRQSRQRLAHGDRDPDSFSRFVQTPGRGLASTLALQLFFPSVVGGRDPLIPADPGYAHRWMSYGGPHAGSNYVLLAIPGAHLAHTAPDVHWHSCLQHGRLIAASFNRR